MDNISGLNNIISGLSKNNQVKAGGLWGSASTYLVASLLKAFSDKKSFLLITRDNDSADILLDDLLSFIALLQKKEDLAETKSDIVICPEEEIAITATSDNRHTDNKKLTNKSIQEKMLFLKNLVELKPRITICAKANLFSAFPTNKELDASICKLEKGQNKNRAEFVGALLKNGYQRTLDEVVEPGEINIRGGITDIFPFGLNQPLRVEWDGDVIGSIRYFSVDSRLSTGEIESVAFNITKTPSISTRPDEITLLDYFASDTIIVFIDTQQKTGAPSASVREISAGQEKLLEQAIKKYHKLYLYDFPISEQEGYSFNIKTLQRFSLGFTNVLKELEKICADNKFVQIFSQNKAEEQHLKELLNSSKFVYAHKVKFRQGRLSEGFIFQDIKTAFISHHEIFNRYRQLRKIRRPVIAPLVAKEAFWEMQRGDFAVHNTHGIGRYRGLQKLHGSEFLALEYQDKSLIYVPIFQMDMVNKYWGAELRLTSVDKIGSSAWASRKERVKNAVKRLAQELLYVQAIRVKKSGFAYPADTEWQIEFESAFPYEETPDQTSISEVLKKDMENEKPMDRLICGDVGYGKTELAMRAAFKSCTAGKQVAIIAPTTILAQQHFQTFSERMADYPLNIDVLSRFKTDAEQRDTIKRLAEGRIDIIIGTHRLIQDDIKLKNLGLVIIDEEQRFGVEHKEFFKKMKASVDVLTLSATPIPRTLHMALSGLREISTMTTPPQDRQAIQTIVCRFDEALIKDAILREVNRHGQIYFVHNRIFDIEKVADKLKSVVPVLSDRIVIAHGQMPAHELERKMKDFVNGKYDILISTNIIESGLDIPRVNTIFIHNANNFGLSDLHQLRGRVGRYKHQAYAYFIIPPQSVIGTDAAKRLKAIEEFNELGAGFKIAMRDMEIRGVGNILGKEQSGYIAAIGYELYCRLLEKTVKLVRRTHDLNKLITKSEKESVAEKVIEKAEKQDQAAQFKITDDIDESPMAEVNLKVDAYIPQDYIPLEKDRLEIYRKLAMAKTPDTLFQIRKELQDRFGSSIPPETNTLIKIMLLRLRLTEKGIISLIHGEPDKYSNNAKDAQLTIAVKKQMHATGDNADMPRKEWLFALRKQYPNKIRLMNGHTIHFYLPIKNPSRILDTLLKLF